MTGRSTTRPPAWRPATARATRKSIAPHRQPRQSPNSPTHPAPVAPRPRPRYTSLQARTAPAKATPTMRRTLKAPLAAALLAAAALLPAQAFAGSQTLSLIRSTLSNDTDADNGGLWQYEGGSVQNYAAPPSAPTSSSAASPPPAPRPTIPPAKPSPSSSPPPPAAACRRSSPWKATTATTPGKPAARRRRLRQIPLDRRRGRQRRHRLRHRHHQAHPRLDRLGQPARPLSRNPPSPPPAPRRVGVGGNPPTQANPRPP